MLPRNLHTPPRHLHAPAMRCRLHVHHPLALTDILCTCPRRSQIHLHSLATFPHPLHPLYLALLTEASCRSSPSDVVDEPPGQAPSELPPRARLPSSERAPSSSHRVSKHQSTEPPQDHFTNDSELPAESGSISSTTSTACAPCTSPTQSSGASTPCPSQHRRFPICRFFRGRLAVDSHLRPFPGPAAATKTSALTSRTSSTTSLALATNGPTPHQRCPPSDRRRRRKSYPGEHLTPLAPQINSPCHPIALATAPHHLVDGRRRIWPVPLPATVGSKLPYFL
jgi:hypothetical protein